MQTAKTSGVGIGDLNSLANTVKVSKKNTYFLETRVPEQSLRILLVTEKQLLWRSELALNSQKALCFHLRYHLLKSAWYTYDVPVCFERIFT